MRCYRTISFANSKPRRPLRALRFIYEDYYKHSFFWLLLYTLLIYARETRRVSGEMKTKPHSNSDYIPKAPFRLGIVGMSETGKTTEATNLLTNKKYLQHYFDFILIFAKVPNQAHYDKIKSANKRPWQTVHVTEYDSKLLGEVIESQRENREEFGCKTDGDDDVTKCSTVLIMFDDYSKEKKIYKDKTFSTLMDQGRHLNISTLFLAHAFQDMPKVHRTALTDVILFEAGEKTLKEIYEYEATSRMAPRHFAQFTEFVFRDKYKFLYIRKKRHVTEGRFSEGYTNPLYIPKKYQMHTLKNDFAINE